MALRGHRNGVLATTDIKIVILYDLFSPIVLTSEATTPPKEVILLQAGALGAVWSLGA